MDPNEFKKVRAMIESECAAIMYAKNVDYATTTDVLANFKRLADRLGMDPLAIWAVYFTKHIDAILSFVRHKKVASEPIRGRFFDARNYLDLGLALLEEQRDQEPMKNHAGAHA